VPLIERRVRFPAGQDVVAHLLASSVPTWHTISQHLQHDGVTEPLEMLRVRLSLLSLATALTAICYLSLLIFVQAHPASRRQPTWTQCSQMPTECPALPGIYGVRLRKLRPASICFTTIAAVAWVRARLRASRNTAR